MSCVACGSVGSIFGVLCEGCASRICGSTALCPEQVEGGGRTAGHAALVDRWGRTHPIEAAVVVGRRPGEGGLAIAEPSISRRHAVLEQFDDGWRIRDLDSANGTKVNAEAVEAPVALRSSDVVSFAGIAFYFIARSVPLPKVVSDRSTLRPPNSVANDDELEAEETFSGLRSAKTKFVAPSGGGAGMLMVDGKTTALTLVQYELLTTLADRMRGETSVDERVRGFVRSTELLATLPWDTSSPDDNHLKQLVRRVRRTLARAGIADIIEARHGFGYRLRIVPRE